MFLTQTTPKNLEDLEEPLPILNTLSDSVTMPPSPNGRIKKTLSRKPYGETASVIFLYICWL